MISNDTASGGEFDYVGHEVTVNTNEEEERRILCQVKWFNDKLGYGFLTDLCALRHGQVIDTGTEHDIFVYMDDIKPKISSYKTLYTGEYVEITKVAASDGRFQAKNVTGPQNNGLMVDFGRIRYIAYYKAHFRGSEPRFATNFDTERPPNSRRRRRKKRRTSRDGTDASASSTNASTDASTNTSEPVVTSILTHEDDE